MAQRLFAITNTTGQDATYSSTEYSKDRCAVPKNSVTHTGGSDGDYVKIADCSDSTYFSGHHCTVTANDQSWTVTIWNDDENGHLFYWSPSNNFTTAHPVQGSQNWRDVALIIVPGQSPTVYCSQWT